MRGSALENLKGAKSRAKALDFALLESLDSARTQNITFWVQISECECSEGAMEREENES